MADTTHTWPIDIETLLVPIAPARPAGESLRYDATYDRIKEARRADDANLPQGVWETELKRADWQTVNDLCIEALRTSSKDLQIAAWLFEAWLHLHGQAGVERGLQLLIGLCERFWSTVYPGAEGDNLEARTAPIRWMDEHLSLALKQIRITHPQTNDVPAYSWLDWENALHFEALTRKNPNLLRTAEAERRVTKARFRESIMLTPTSALTALAQRVDAILNTLHDFEAILNERCGEHAPSLLQFKGVLANMHQLVSNTLVERNTGDTAVSTEVYQTQGGGEHSHRGTPIRSRADAYQQLAAIAEYLVTVEPHSPTPYLIKRAVSWGCMSLTDLLLELVTSPSDRRAIYDLLGIKQEGES